jgi:hypothetical protein
MLRDSLYAFGKGMDHVVPFPLFPWISCTKLLGGRGKFVENQRYAVWLTPSENVYDLRDQFRLFHDSKEKV